MRLGRDEPLRASFDGARAHLYDAMLEMIAIGLAGWRIASLLVQEAGPWHVFEWLRHRVGIREVGEPEGFFPELLSCVWCMSIWTCLGAWGAWQFAPQAVILAAAMSVAVVTQRAARG